MKLARVYSTTAATNLLLQGTGLVTGVIAARGLGPAGRGDFAVVLLWPTLISAVCYFSIAEAAGYLTARNRERAVGLRWLTLKLTLALGIAGGLAGYVALPHLLAPTQSHLIGITRWYLFMLPLGYVAGALSTSFAAELRFSLFNFLRAIQPLTYFAGCVLLFLKSKVSIEHLVVASLTGYLVTIILGLIVAHRTESLIGSATRQDLWEVIKTAATFYMTAVAAILAGRLDQIMIARSLGASDIGQYAVAVSVSTAHLALAGSFSQVATTLVASSTRAEAPAMVAHQFQLAWTTALATTLLMAAIAPAFVQIAYGQAFSKAIVLIWLLLPGSMASMLVGILGLGMRGLGRPLIAPLATVASAALFLSFSIPLRNSGGVFGIAAATSLAGSSVLLLIVRWITAAYKLPMASFWTPNPSSLKAVFLGSRLKPSAEVVPSM